MVETYFSLAKSAEGFSRFEDDGVIGCQSESTHPAANFAIVARPNIHSVTRMAERSSHTAYILPTDQGQAVVEMMSKAGYAKGSTLNLMFLRQPDAGIDLDIESVTKSLDRYDHMMFLAKQFFSAANNSFCEGIAALTAEAKDCELVRLPGRNGPMGGAMLTQTGPTLGLYNITVAPEHRHRGLGANLVRSLVGVAASRKSSATLQCSDSLVPWYEKLGFRRYGSVVLMRK